MGALERILKQIRHHLSGLTVSQQLVLGLCGVIIVISTIGLLHWSGQKIAIPLLNQDLSPEELASMQAQLDDLGVEHKSVGGRLFVYASTQERREILAKLVRNGGLPKNTEIGFQEIIKETSVLASSSERDRLWTLGLANELSMTFGLMEGVERAQVYLDKREKRRIHGPSIVPTASVSLWMTNGVPVDKKLAQAVAGTVAGAVSGLEPWNVRVTDMVAGRSIPIPDPAKGISQDMLEKREQMDRYFEKRIEQQLSFILGVRVAVFSELITENLYEQAIEGEKLKRKEKTKNLLQRRVTPGQEPGVVPNTGQNIASATRSDEMTLEESETENDGVPNQKTTTRQSLLGSLKSITASVGIPRRYLVMVFKQENAGAEEDPKDSALEPIKTQIFADVRTQVGNIIHAEDPETQVAVSIVHEVDDPMTAMKAQLAGKDGGLGGMARRYLSEAGLGALALVSLMMMLMMVRHASSGPNVPAELMEVATEEDLEGLGGLGEEMTMATPLGALNVAGEPIGNAIQAPGMLEGKELDENALRSQQLVDQVSAMIRDQPEMAADLIEKWINDES